MPGKPRIYDEAGRRIYRMSENDRKKARELQAKPEQKAKTSAKRRTARGRKYKREYMKEYRSTDEGRESSNAIARRYYSDPENKARHNARMRIYVRGYSAGMQCRAFAPSPEWSEEETARYAKGYNSGRRRMLDMLDMPAEDTEVSLER